MREALGIALLAVALVGSALLFGAQHTPVLVVCALASAASALLLAPAKLPRFGWLLAALAAYTMLQVVPLPLGLVARLSPASAAVWRDALAPLHQTVSFATLSVDPAATALEALKWSAYVCVLVAATGWRSRHRAVVLALLLAGSALVVCVVTLFHGLFDVKKIYGLYAPVDDWRWTRGPFVNGNNLAGYLNLGLFAGAGVWFSARTPRLAAPLALALPVLGVGVLLADSRAATVSIAVGLVLFTGLLVAQRPGARPGLVLTLGGTALVVLALAVAGAGARTWEIIGNADLGAKARVWVWALPLVRDFPWFGVGRGAFETAFLPYRQPIAKNYTTVYAQAENFPLQWVTDWGVPIGLGALVAFAVLGVGPLKRARRNPLAAGLVAGLAALFLQNLADLALELFAVGAAALVALAGADDAVDEPTKRSIYPALPGAIAVAVWAVIVCVTGAHPVQVDRRAVAARYAALGPSRAAAPEFDELLAGLMRRHPGEAYFPLMGGAEAMRTGRDPLPWLGRAVERSPLDGQAHLLLADALAARGARLQSLLHSRLAALYDGLLRERALAQIASRVKSLSDLDDAFPRDLPGNDLLADVCDKLEPALVIGCWREANARGKTDEVGLGLAAALLRAGESGTEPCAGAARERCEDEAVALLDRLQTSGASAAKVAEVRARLLSSKGDEAHAAKLLAASCASRADAVTCYGNAFELALRSRDPLTLGEISDRFAAVVCSEPNRCADVHERTGRAYLELSAPGLALRQFTSAVEANPNADRWLLAAEAAAKAGALATARRALEQAKREPEPAPQQAERITAIENALSDTAPGN
ncbi:MAG TPA: O-antigen ligase family protein [Polyangiaceae bacterium]|nr:O-antigen ligase family protein [Polyangiaceae bacterium]